MGSSGSKQKSEPAKKAPSPKTETKTSNVIKTDDRRQEKSQPSQVPQQRQQQQQQTTENNNVSKVHNTSGNDSRKRHFDKDDENIDDLDLDAGWYGNKSATKVRNVNSSRTTNELNESNNRRNQEVHRPDPREEYPETYAQRNLRELYRRNDLLRQKTIYRDPEQWDDSEQQKVEDYGFDIEKFKEANKHAQAKRDIFGDVPEYALRDQSNNEYADNFYGDRRERTRGIQPSYDSRDEELMADIEKEFID